MFSLNPIVSFMYLLFHYLAHKCSHWFLSLLFIVSLLETFQPLFFHFYPLIFYSNMSLIFFIVFKFFLRYLKILFFYPSCVSWLNTIYMSMFIFNFFKIGFNININVFIWQILIMLFSSNSHFIFCFVYVILQKDITLNWVWNIR